MCKFVYLYEYGGLYGDLDADIDFDCFQKFAKSIKPGVVFFEATSINTIDLFAIYTPKPKNPYLKKVFESYVTYNTFAKTFSYATA